MKPMAQAVLQTVDGGAFRCVTYPRLRSRTGDDGLIHIYVSWETSCFWSPF